MKNVFFAALFLLFATDMTAVEIPDEITLEKAIAIALENNPLISSMADDVSQYDASIDSAKAKFWPKLSGTLGYTSYLNGQRAVPTERNGEAGVFSHNILSGDLILKVPLFEGLKTVNEKRSFEFLKRSAEQSLLRSKEELVFNVTVVFYQILFQEKIIESLNFSKKTLEKSLNFVEELIKSQKAVENDKLKVEVAVSDIEQSIENEKNVLEIQKRTLLNLMGSKDIKDSFFIRGQLEKETGALPQKNELINSILSSRNDYAALKLKSESQSKIVETAKGDYWPVLSAFGSYGAALGIAPYDNPDNKSIINDRGQLGILLEIPIFEGFATVSKVKKENAKLNQIKNQMSTLELKIALEVEKAYLNLVSFSGRISSALKAVTLAESNLSNEEEKYNSGKATLLDVLDAQSSLLKAKVTYFASIANYKISEAELKLATGEDL